MRLRILFLFFFEIGYFEIWNIYTAPNFEIKHYFETSLIPCATRFTKDAEIVHPLYFTIADTFKRHGVDIAV